MAMPSRVSHFESCLPGPSVGKGAGNTQFSSVYSSRLGNCCPSSISAKFFSKEEWKEDSVRVEAVELSPSACEALALTAKAEGK